MFWGESVDVVRVFSLFALDIIMRAAFGMEADVQLNPDPDFVEKAKRAFQTPLWVRFFSMFPFWEYIGRWGRYKTVYKYSGTSI